MWNLNDPTSEPDNSTNDTMNLSKWGCINASPTQCWCMTHLYLAETGCWTHDFHWSACTTRWNAMATDKEKLWQAGTAIAGNPTRIASSPNGHCRRQRATTTTKTRPEIGQGRGNGWCFHPFQSYFLKFVSTRYWQDMYFIKSSIYILIIPSTKLRRGLFSSNIKWSDQPSWSYKMSQTSWNFPRTSPPPPFFHDDAELVLHCLSLHDFPFPDSLAYYTGHLSPYHRSKNSGLRRSVSF